MKINGNEYENDLFLIFFNYKKRFKTSDIYLKNSLENIFLKFVLKMQNSEISFELNKFKIICLIVFNISLFKMLYFFK